MSAMKSVGVTPKAFQMAGLEPSKYRRKPSVLLPLGVVALFGLWGVAIMFNSGSDDRAAIINLVQLGGLMLPLLIGSSVLILVGEDKNTNMTSRAQSLGIALPEIGFAKALWALAAGFSGLLAITVSTVVAGHAVGMTPPGNSLVIVLFALAAEIVCLVPAFLNIALRKRGQGLVLALSLGGALLGSAGHFLPQHAAALTPFTFAGALTPARINQDGVYDVSFSVALPIIVLTVTVIVCAVSIAFFPRRVHND